MAEVVLGCGCLIADAGRHAVDARVVPVPLDLVAFVEASLRP